MKLKRRIPNVPKMEDRLISSGSRRYHVHGRRNPAGSKLTRRFFKAKHGVKASAAKAVAWYRAWNPAN